MKTAFTTPMMRQYAEIKKDYPDALLFFRLGDFYELFLQDAEIGAEVLDITLTARPRGKDGKIPMAGVPYHAVDSYLAKLIKAGYKVAICEQVSEPDGKGIVEREVVRVVTPGTVLDEKALSRKTNNYIMSFSKTDEILAISSCDVSTGQMQTKQSLTDNFLADLLDEVDKLSPAECILPAEYYQDHELLKALKSGRKINIFEFKNWNDYANEAPTFLKKHFDVKTLKHLGIEDKRLSQISSAALIGYLQETQKSKLKHIKKITLMQSEDSMMIDRSSMANLEIFSTIRERETKGTLISILDGTKTAMGGRKLRRWLISPLKNKEEINKRLDMVEKLVDDFQKREEIVQELKKVNDIERTLAKISSGIGNPRDLITLKSSVKRCLDIKEKLKQVDTKVALEVRQCISQRLNSLVKLIENSILSEPAVNINEGDVIKPGYSKDLDSLRKSILNDQEWILNLEKKEREKSGIQTLKIGFNKVFGYYIEVSKTQAKSVPQNYIRKQTLVNAERFVTQEMKAREEKILGAEENIKRLEKKLFNEVVQKILSYIQPIQQAADSIATLDILCNFAHIAYENDYCRPTLLYGNELSLKKSRHPVIEQVLSAGNFVPNDITIKPSKQNLLLITGPNMAGKSVLMRQVALIVLMAQIGSFVPASAAYIGIVDRIFVRSGASDVISSGLSTFMTEMVETAYILNHATKRSLIIMDEIGRGTSTYDGISIAWATAEFLTKLSPKTLFETHYHELQKLEEKYPNKIVNYKMDIKREKKAPVFLYKFKKGSAPHSFGIQVAKMAGMPRRVVKSAQKILAKLEDNRDQDNTASPQSAKIFGLMQNLEKVDIDNLTPVEALNILADMKEKLQEK